MANWAFMRALLGQPDAHAEGLEGPGPCYLIEGGSHKTWNFLS